MPPARDDAPGLLSRLAARAWRYVAQFEPHTETIQVPRAHVDAAPTTARVDCGPGGCGPGSLLGGGLGPTWASITPSLDRPTVDDLMSDSLMRRIVKLIVDDAMKVRPMLSGDLGELTPCIDWLAAKGFWVEAKRAMYYARAYGGGGILCIVDDGRRADEEIDLLGLQDIKGFYALPKWYLVPDGIGSARVTAAWYGQRIGRPEHYYATPVTGLGSATAWASAAEATVGRESERVFAPADINKILNKSGRRFHRSRVIPWPYCDEMDLRLARWFPQWNGWGPGVVEAVVAPFLAYRSSALRVSSIMRSIIVNTVKITDLEHRQSTPDYGAMLRQYLDVIKACRDYTEDSVPLIATDSGSEFKSLTHNVSGIDKMIATLRQYMLDNVEYPGVVLFGDSVGGLNGGDRKGEWRAYAAIVRSLQDSWVWEAGSFGGGLRQAALLAMGCKRGPTDGQMDMSVKATWPAIVEESAEDAAATRLKNAQARAQDALVLKLTPDALARHDPTVIEAYPSLDVDDGPLPVLEEPELGESVPEGTEEAQVGGTSPAKPAMTPGATNTALAEEQGVEAPKDAEPALPMDIHTEAEIAAALKMSRTSLRQLLAEQGVSPVIARKGARGGGRYSLGRVLAALEHRARQRVDAFSDEWSDGYHEARMDPFPNEHAARQSPPGGKEFRKSIAPGVSLLLKKSGGKSEVQSVRLSKKKFTASEAKRWLKENGYSTAQFEPAR